MMRASFEECQDFANTNFGPEDFAAEATLIERLAKETEPNRELANEILLACGWCAYEEGNGPDRYLMWRPPHEGIDECGDGDQPNPLASLDAAVALLPDGCKWKMDFSKYVPWIAEVHLPGGHGYLYAECDSGPTFALCLAVLKARAVLPSQGHSSEQSE